MSIMTMMTTMMMRVMVLGVGSRLEPRFPFFRSRPPGTHPNSYSFNTLIIIIILVVSQTGHLA